jgi:putative copper export protein/mono/diheme cytochrome c family protein
VPGLGIRFLYTGAVFLALGALLVVALCRAPEPSRIDPVRLRTLRFAAGALCAALALSLLVLAVQALDVAGKADAQVLSSLLLNSRFGTVWLLRQAALAAALGAVAFMVVRTTRRAATAHGVALLAIFGSLAVAAWAGHSVALDPWWTALPAHAMHLIGTAAWLGSLPVLLWLLVREPALGADALARFSRLALWMMIAIVGSGLWLALAHVERWPALLGTGYGAQILGKAALLCAVLAIAGRLRRALLVRARTGEFDARAAARFLAIELSLATPLLFLATSLGRTIPARHDEIAWLFPFRISIDATWLTPGVPATVAAAAALIAVGIGMGVWLVQRGARAGAIGAAALGGAGAILLMRALSVQAYPETYRKPSVPYHAISVANGAQLYAVHCVACHGPSAHGDGPAAAGLALAPADLTEPHTALHTAGDIFWWLTHGKPPGVMPGFADRLSEDQRWDLINFVRALSSGYQARILTERVVPRVPWLPSVDFSFVLADGTSGTLKDYRGRSAVLLVFYSLPGSARRLTQLAASSGRLREAGAELIAIPVDEDRDALAQGPATVVEGATETASSYALFRRTLSNADPRDAAPIPAHMEMLVDRFGYIRARWVPADGEGWTRIDALLAQLAALAREPQVRPPPEDHVH